MRLSLFLSLSAEESVDPELEERDRLREELEERNDSLKTTMEGLESLQQDYLKLERQVEALTGSEFQVDEEEEEAAAAPGDTENSSVLTQN